MRGLSEKEKKELSYLACEHRRVYLFLMLTAGMWGAYTYNLRGGVFCNAQTANVLMIGISFGNFAWQKGFYYLIPLCAYIFGTIVSELLPSPVKRIGFLRWDTYLIAFEMAVCFLIGFIPFGICNSVVHVMISFLAAMQYNTFREAEGIPVATTFCTNHVRQVGVLFAGLLRGRKAGGKKRKWFHGKMLVSFFLGALLETFVSKIWATQFLRLEKSIWLTLLPLGVVFVRLVYADLIVERGLLYRVPSGH